MRISLVLIALGMSQAGYCQSQCRRAPAMMSEMYNSTDLSRKLADNLLQFARNQSYPLPSFSSSANSALPSGVFIATNFPAIVDLAEFLESDEVSNDVNVTYLLLSDSSADDLTRNRGLIDMKRFWKPSEDIWWENDDDITDEEEDARSFNRKLLRRYRPLARDSPNVVNRILNRVAPTLEVFSYLLYTPDEWRSGGGNFGYHARRKSDDNVEDSLFTLTFPRLRELTLRNKPLWKSNSWPAFDYLGHDNRLMLEEGVSDSLYSFPALPSLTHLHIAGFPYPIRTPSLAFLKQTFPLLTHIRLTGTGQPPELKPKYESYRGPVQEMWNAVKVWWNPPSLPNPIPSNLTLFYNPSFPPPRGECGTGSVEYDGELQRLGNLTSTFPDSFQLIWPSREDFEKFGETDGLFPPNRAVKDFEERLNDVDGVEKGEWKALMERPWESPDGWQWP